MSKTKGRARQFAEWTDAPAKDFDPEAEVPEEDSASDSEESVDENAGTEHYVSVGKSKLRRKEPVALGPRYRGTPVSRAALEDDDDDEEPHEDEEDEGEDDHDDENSSNYEDARQDLNGDSGLEEFDDPDEANLEADQDNEDDAEIDSDNAFNESDEEKFKNFVFRGSSQAMPKKGKRVARPTAADYMVSDDDDSGSEGEALDREDGSDEDIDDEEASDDEGIDGFIDDEAEEDDDDEDEDMEDMDDASNTGSEDEDSDEDEYMENDDLGKTPRVNGSGRATIQEMMNTDQRNVAGTLSITAQKDIAKGKAVRQQRKAFDALLNIRIRLQKSLVAVNSFSSVEDLGEQSQPYEAAEAAALKLWNAIDGFRTSIQSDVSTKTGQKRKRTADTDTPNQDIWENMEAVEQRALIRRRAVLEKWSHNARNIRMVDRSSRKFTNTVEKPLTTRLDEELDAPERLIKRTRTPRSCAPAQVARKVNEDPNIYDDADFYQLLLKELVDQRSGDASGAPGGPAATIRFAAVKEAKAKRHVDTKASKGRKMRFNVHDKLQNFMAPEDRRSWEQSAIDRFFATLFGQKMVLNEDEDEKEASDEEMGGAPIVDGGFRLFRD